MNRNLHLALATVLCSVTGCASVPPSVDGLPTSLAEKQAIKAASDKKQAMESGYGMLSPLGLVGPLAVEVLHVAGVNVGHRNPKMAEEAVRKVRQTKQEGDSLSAQLNEAKEYNQKLATHCTELLVEVESLSGKPHATLDQRKDVLDQIKKQMARMDFAGKQTDQAIKKNQELLASVKSSGGGHDKEMTELQAQIERLTAKKSEFTEANANMARIRKEISSS